MYTYWSSNLCIVVNPIEAFLCFIDKRRHVMSKLSSQPKKKAVKDDISHDSCVSISVHMSSGDVLYEAYHNHTATTQQNQKKNQLREKL